MASRISGRTAPNISISKQAAVVSPIYKRSQRVQKGHAAPGLRPHRMLLGLVSGLFRIATTTAGVMAVSTRLVRYQYRTSAREKA
ncbi:MAG TPA: hypothetical protein VD837_14230 [Terriglobales bacterium]|nr:hypothetical protein [Terriglobales bacterium]